MARIVRVVEQLANEVAQELPSKLLLLLVGDIASESQRQGHRAQPSHVRRAGKRRGPEAHHQLPAPTNLNAYRRRRHVQALFQHLLLLLLLLVAARGHGKWERPRGVVGQGGSARIGAV